MKFNLKITKNLELFLITENNWEDETLIAVECHFNFYEGEHAAYISVDKLNSDYPSYAMIESTTELHDSFKNLLETHENWDKITSAVKAFIKEEWEPNNC